jgi:hypothetical protein
VIEQLSVSQVERFDPSQTAGCPRAWWFERVRWLRPEQTRAQTDGDAGHALLAAYLRTGELPGKRVKMGKSTTGAIVKGELPKPGPDLIVEARFDGSPRPAPGAEWPPLDVGETLHLGGVPWDGFIDLAFRRGDVPEIWDHKYTSDIAAHAKKPSELIQTVQLPVYVLSQIPYWPDAKRWRIAHHYVAKTGVESSVRAAVVTLDQVLERKEQIEAVVAQMHVASSATEQGDVAHNRRACSAYSGCPHQSICHAFKEKPVQISPEEAAAFADLEDVFADLDTPAPVTQPPVADPALRPDGKPRRVTITEVAAPVPAPVAEAPAPAPAPTCQCGTALSAENASRLQSGEWKHIGCPLTAPAAPPPAEPKKRRAKAAEPTPAASVPLPVPAPAPEVAAVVSEVRAPAPMALTASPVLPAAVTRDEARESLATVFEGIARLLRSVA